MSIEIILADDHDVVRDGLKAVIERGDKDIKIIGEAVNGREVLKMAEKKPADVYILDVAMPVLNGIETTVRLMKINPKSRIIILTMYDNMSFVREVLKYGAKGYILKENASEEIVHAICEVHKNGCFLSPQIAKYIVNGFLGKADAIGKDAITQLTGREREVLQLVAEGSSSKEVAVQLKISLNTVHVHRNNIMKKLNLHKQSELIKYALKEGITGLQTKLF